MQVQFGQIVDLFSSPCPDQSVRDALAKQAVAEAKRNQGESLLPSPVAFSYDNNAGGASYISHVSGHILATGEDAVILNAMEKVRQTTDAQHAKLSLTKAMMTYIFRHTRPSSEGSEYVGANYEVTCVDSPDLLQKVDEGRGGIL